MSEGTMTTGAIRGEILCEEIDTLGLSANELAKALGSCSPDLHHCDSQRSA